jgi:glutamate-1-semialdehyde 2,1-aminomutase
VHDAAMVSVKPKADKCGSAKAPNQVPASGGIPESVWRNTLVAIFNDLTSAERLFRENLNEVAALILEPVPMNIGICMPQPGYLQGLRDLCTKYGALLIFDEVKTGAKLGRGGAAEYFNVRPDMVCLAKSIGGGFSLSAFAASKKIMDQIADGKVFHAGTYNTNPLVMAASLATLRHVLTPENYARINKMSKRLVEGHNDVIKKAGMHAYAIGVVANGAVMLYGKEVKNYRDWMEIDIDLWRHYWFGMVNRGVIPQPHWWDEQWTVSVAHTEADIERHISAFADLAPALAAAQQERAVAVAR